MEETVTVLFSNEVYDMKTMRCVEIGVSVSAPQRTPIAAETRDSQNGDARMDDIAKMVFLLSIGTIVGTLVVVMIIRKVRSMICFTFQRCTHCRSRHCPARGKNVPYLCKQWRKDNPYMQ